MTKIEDIVDNPPKEICPHVIVKELRIPIMNGCLCDCKDDCQGKYLVGNNVFCGSVYDIK